jgi:hypothetical protein
MRFEQLKSAVNPATGDARPPLRETKRSPCEKLWRARIMGRELLLGKVKEFSEPKLYCGSTKATKKKGVAAGQTYLRYSSLGNYQLDTFGQFGKPIPIGISPIE